jgi:flagellar hook-length control protein FliK
MATGTQDSRGVTTETDKDLNNIDSQYNQALKLEERDISTNSALREEFDSDDSERDLADEDRDSLLEDNKELIASQNISIQGEATRLALSIAASQQLNASQQDLEGEESGDLSQDLPFLLDQGELTNGSSEEELGFEVSHTSNLTFGDLNGVDKLVGARLANSKDASDEGDIDEGIIDVAGFEVIGEDSIQDGTVKSLNSTIRTKEGSLAGQSAELDQVKGLEDVAIRNSNDFSQKALSSEDITSNDNRNNIAAQSDVSVTDRGSKLKNEDLDSGLFESEEDSQYQRDSQPPATKIEGNIQTLLLRHAFESVHSKNNGEAVELARDRNPENIALQGASNAPETKSAAEQGARSRPLTRPQLVRMLERVESTLKEAARSRDGKTISLNLEPVDLGKIKVDVSLRDGVLHARISPENEQVLTALREHAHELQGTLRKLGLDVDSVTVSVTADEFSRQMAGGQDGANNGGSSRGDRQNMPSLGRQVPERTNGNEIATEVASGVNGSGRGNLGADYWIA